MANGLITWDSGELLIHGKAPGMETKSIVSYLPERTISGGLDEAFGSCWISSVIFTEIFSGSGRRKCWAT